MVHEELKLVLKVVTSPFSRFRCQQMPVPKRKVAAELLRLENPEGEPVQEPRLHVHASLPQGKD